MEMAYYPGCSLQQSAKLYDLQTKKICSALGITLQEIPDWNCCGATSAAKVDPNLALALPARNIALIEQMGQREVVIPCSACYSRTSVALFQIQHQQGKKEQLARDNISVQGNVQLLTILELLKRSKEENVLADKIKNHFKGINVACYYGCMLSRFPEDIPLTDDPENPSHMEDILSTFGCHPIDWNLKTFCCGASASVNDKPVAFRLMAKIFTDALARNVNCLATSCPMCQMNLDAYQDAFCKQYNISQRLPIFFITELVGLALGLSTQELQLERHFIDGTALIKENLEHV